MSDFAQTTRYRYGARDVPARASHAAASTEWRRSLREADLGSDEQRELFAALRAGLPLTAAAGLIGLHTSAVYGRARWDTDFEDQLEAVLRETCPAGAGCGRPVGVKYGGHCRDCREAHHPPRRSVK